MLTYFFLGYLIFGVFIGLFSRSKRDRYDIAVFFLEVFIYLPEILYGLGLGIKDNGGPIKTVKAIYHNWKWHRS